MAHETSLAAMLGGLEWLRSAYPQDRALGYGLGDLRGFWWAEAPRR
jgi:hypothetical protein